jgi:hypothetical protein
MNFCACCGLFVYASSVIDKRAYALVNANTLSDPVRVTETQVVNCEGESTEDKIARRRRTWIANVTMTMLAARVPCPAA